jgi:hypothetical protein
MAHNSAQIHQLPAHSYHYNTWGAHFCISLSTAAVVGALGLKKPTVIRNFKSVSHLQFNLLNPITVSFIPGANSLCDKAAIEVCFTRPFLLKSDSTKAQTPLSVWTVVTTESCPNWGFPVKGKSLVPNYSVQFWGPKPHQWQVGTLVPGDRRATTWWPLWSLTTTKVINAWSYGSLPHTSSLWGDQQRAAILTLPNK